MRFLENTSQSMCSRDSGDWFPTLQNQSNLTSENSTSSLMRFPETASQNPWYGGRQPWLSFWIWSWELDWHLPNPMFCDAVSRNHVIFGAWVGGCHLWLIFLGCCWLPQTKAPGCRSGSCIESRRPWLWLQAYAFCAGGHDPYANLGFKIYRYVIILILGRPPGFLHVFPAPVFLYVSPFSKAQGQAVQDYLTNHQDRSRNALTKSMRAAFSSWCEDLKADQAQFVQEKLLSLSLQFQSLLSSIDIKCGCLMFTYREPCCKVQWLRAEKEVAKARTKLIQQLEDLSVIPRK